MPHQGSRKDSSAISHSESDETAGAEPGPADIYDLDLPEVAEGEGPLPWPEPSYAMQIEHARFLLIGRPPEFFAARLAQVNPEPFRMD